MDEMIGRVDMLDMRDSIEHWKAKGIDLSAIFYNPPVPGRVGRRYLTPQNHGLEQALDYKLIDHARDALEGGNVHRAEAADPQHTPHGRRHAERRNCPAHRLCRTCPKIPSVSISAVPPARVSVHSWSMASL